VSLIPGIGVIKGMLLTLTRFFQPKETIQYPEEMVDISPHHRGRLVLLYDEYGALKCETCFQCAQACPIEIIDMGGVDTKNRYHVHWGASEQYAERREESALRRSGRVVPDATFRDFTPVEDLGPIDAILSDVDHDPRQMLAILERAQEAYGHLPVAILKHISNQTGAWYSEIYGIASFYQHLRLEPVSVHTVGICRCPSCTLLGGGRFRDALEETLATPFPGVSPDGGVRFEAVDCHGDNDGDPLVVIDGERIRPATAGELIQIAQRLRAERTPAARV
jgi:NADH-quinone oxidoreductase subunit E